METPEPLNDLIQYIIFAGAFYVLCVGVKNI